MRILVLSDSHGATEHMIKCVEREEPQHILFLGDGLGDCHALQRRFPDIPLDAVAGNCDIAPTQPTERLITIGGKRILMCHGHTYQVDYAITKAVYSAKEQEADVLLFGHTHRPMVDNDGTLQVMNPGSISNLSKPIPGMPTYGIITINSNTFRCDLYRL